MWGALLGLAFGFCGNLPPGFPTATEQLCDDGRDDDCDGRIDGDDPDCEVPDTGSTDTGPWLYRPTGHTGHTGHTGLVDTAPHTGVVRPFDTGFPAPEAPQDTGPPVPTGDTGSDYDVAPREPSDTDVDTDTDTDTDVDTDAAPTGETPRSPPGHRLCSTAPTSAGGGPDAARAGGARPPPLRAPRRAEGQLIRTYSYSTSWPLMPRAGAAIQLAIFPGSYTGTINEVT